MMTIYINGQLRTMVYENTIYVYCAFLFSKLKEINCSSFSILFVFGTGKYLLQDKPLF